MSKIQEFDFSVNLLESLLWQYNDAETLQSLLDQKQSWFNENYTDFWNNWYNDVFNLATANEFGLTVWSKILDVSFSLPPQAVRNDNVFGYGDFYNNFFESNFSPTGGDDTSLTTEQKRSVLQLTYFKYVSRGTVPDINKTLTSFFGFKVYILDGLNMTGLVVLTQTVNQENLEIIKEFDLIPRPAAVKVEFTTVTGNEFGFADYGMNYFNGFFGA
jgi:hypothetical protein